MDDIDGTDPAKPSEDTPDIRMDAMAFGMGNCCLQITFQAYNVAEATRVYDALVPIAPIMVRILIQIKTNTLTPTAGTLSRQPGFQRLPSRCRCTLERDRR